jgi:hypothetical protein
MQAGICTVLFYPHTLTIPCTAYFLILFAGLDASALVLSQKGPTEYQHKLPNLHMSRRFPNSRSTFSRHEHKPNCSSRAKLGQIHILFGEKIIIIKKVEKRTLLKVKTECMDFYFIFSDT